MHCRNIEEATSSIKDIAKFYVTNGMVQFDDAEYPLDSKIPALPALIVGNGKDCKVYCGEKYILDFLNKSGEK